VSLAEIMVAYTHTPNEKDVVGFKSKDGKLTSTVEIVHLRDPRLVGTVRHSKG
jgi:hypothetical protein